MRNRRKADAIRARYRLVTPGTGAPAPINAACSPHYAPIPSGPTTTRAAPPPNVVPRATMGGYGALFAPKAPVIRLRSKTPPTSSWFGP